MGVVFLIVIIVIAVWVLASCVRIVPQAYAVILERLELIRRPGVQEFTSRFRLLNE